MIGAGLRGDRLQALAQHLAALAEGRPGHRLEGADAAGQGLRRGVRCTTLDVTFGGGTKAEGGTSNRMRASVAPAAQHAEAAVILRVALVGDDALGHLALEHQRERLPPGRPGLAGEPARQQRRADIVGQVGDDPRRRAAERAAAGRRRSASASTTSSRPG